MNVPASALRTVGMLFDTLGEVKELDLQSVSPELRPAALYKIASYNVARAFS